MEALGVEMLLKIRIGDAMVPVAGLITDAVVVDSESIDVTNKDSQTWRTLIGNGKRTVDISSTAFILDDAAQAVLKQAYIDDASLICDVSDGIDVGFSGTFRIGQFDINGGYDGAEEFALTLHSIDASVDPGYVPPEPEVTDNAEAWGFTSYAIGQVSDRLVRLGLRPFQGYTIS